MKNRSLLALAVATAAVAGCGRNLSEPTGEGYRDLEADKVIYGVHYTPTEDGVPKAIGVFDTVFVYQDSSIYSLRGVKLEIYNAEGKPAATVTSEAGRLNQATDAMTATGNVVLVTTDNVRIETQELHYDPTSHRVWSDVETHRFSADGKELIADSFSADDRLDRIEYLHPRGDVSGLRLNFR
jgi:LPS export ABC transporter protein LptC